MSDALDISYCVVNTNGREDLMSCLAAIEATHPEMLKREVLVLDNASGDGSAEMVADSFPDAELVALERRTGKAENDSTLLRRARGRYCLLLNEDAELEAGATAALVDALDHDMRAGAAGALLLSTNGDPVPCAWRLPSPKVSLAGVLFAHRRYTVQSGGSETRSVGWVQSSAMLVRSSAAHAVGYLDPAFFVYSDETDFCKRLHDAGWDVLHVPGARAIHHDQLTHDLGSERRRLVEFHRNRARYMRKHHGRRAELTARALGAVFYALRAAAALVLPGHDPRRYLLQTRQELAPWRGEGIREAAEAYNARAGTRTPAPLE